MIRYGKIFLKFAGLDLSSDLRYKLNLLIKFISFVTMDFIGPLVGLLIYTNTLGIPGWSFHEFLLLQGTLVLVLGLGHTFVFKFSWEVMHMVRYGEFDTIMVKPLKPLIYLVLGSFNFTGFSEIFAGLAIIIYAIINLNIGFTLGYILYIIFILLAVLFQLGVATLISAMAFIFIRSWALFDVWFNLVSFARYPSIIFSFTIRFIISFIFPIAIASYYPAAILLGKLSFTEAVMPLIGMIIFYIITHLLWNLAMKKYASAGG